MHAGPAYKRWLNAPVIGGVVLGIMMIACFVSLPYTLGAENEDAPPRFKHQQRELHHVAPLDAVDANGDPIDKSFIMGTDNLGQSMAVRCLLGGAISLGIGLAAALISVSIGTLWGIVAGYAGGRVDSVMMRCVDVLYGLPYILLVILLAIAADGLIKNYQTSVNKHYEQPEFAEQIKTYQDALSEAAQARTAYEAMPQDDPARPAARLDADQLKQEADRLDPYPGLYRFTIDNQWLFDLSILFIAIGSVSWLTLARVVRGQVLSLKAQPFIESARACGIPTRRILLRHILPNLIGPIIVYTTLTVPQAILQESFLSFLGIGVKDPLPSWGNLASNGLSELNPVKGHWWLLVWPCTLLGVTLLALNFLGDGLRDRFDPRTRKA